MSDWSEKMAEKIRQKNKRQTDDHKSVEIKRQVGPQAWAALKSDVAAEGNALNAELGNRQLVQIESSSDTELIVRAHLHDSVRRLHVQFDPHLAQVAWPGGTFELAVGEDGRPAFHSDNGVQVGTRAIARQMLESIIGS